MKYYILTRIVNWSVVIGLSCVFGILGFLFAVLIVVPLIDSIWEALS